MNEDLTPAKSAALVLDEAETLIWALLDDQLGEVDAAKLAKLLEAHESVRRRYLECVQLHVDLQEHFAAVGVRAVPQIPSAILPDLTGNNLPDASSPLTQ
jgi:anti-sigma factor RsiW